MSQTVARDAARPMNSQFSHFVNLLKSEAEREQFVLATNRPVSREAEALAQPQHRLKARDGAPRRREAAEPADLRHHLLHPEMVALDHLLQMLGDAVDHGRRQQTSVHAVLDRGGVDVGAVRADLARRQQGLILHRLAEETLGGGEIAMGGQQEVDRRSVLVDGAVEVPPFPANFHISLVDADRTAMRLAETAQAFLDHRRVGQNPAVDGRVIDVEAALGEQAFEVPIAQGVTQVPVDRLHDQPGFKMAALEVALGALLELLGEGVENHGVGLRRRLLHAARSTPR